MGGGGGGGGEGGSSEPAPAFTYLLAHNALSSRITYVIGKRPTLVVLFQNQLNYKTIK